MDALTLPPEHTPGFSLDKIIYQLFQYNLCSKCLNQSKDCLLPFVDCLLSFYGYQERILMDIFGRMKDRKFQTDNKPIVILF